MKVIGRERELEIIKRYLDKRYSSYSFLFEGKDCIGKKAVALLTAKSFLCETEYNMGCGRCQSCNLVNNTFRAIYYNEETSLHPFIKVITSLDGKDIKIDQIREGTNFLKLKNPTGKVLIIEKGELLNKEASNALLKTLEEPPENSLIIITSSKPDKILPTILSRTLKIKFRPLKDDEIRQILELKGFSNTEINNFVKISEGSLCLPLKLKEKKVLLKYAKDLTNLLLMKKLHIEGILSFSEIVSKLDLEDIRTVLDITEKLIHKNLLSGNIKIKFYENFIQEKKLLDLALSKSVKVKLALEGFYLNLKSDLNE